MRSHAQRHKKATLSVAREQFRPSAVPVAQQTANSVKALTEWLLLN